MAGTVDNGQKSKLTAEQAAEMLANALADSGTISDLIGRANELMQIKRDAQDQLQDLRDTLATLVRQNLVTDAQRIWIEQFLPKREYGPRGKRSGDENDDNDTETVESEESEVPQTEAATEQPVA